ncbi:TPA: hypothetical protein N0F65_005570 [Lagenidium giganteum]|uniref:Uncharacterized protein n=1 Tax=Lagenidium giganteum TaxID=4803 RepID=A0AAV2Z283_9STRA|nr:TPA: hypothetical protein N0F65_005570 [Lagenidium giganteum]
MHHQQCLPTSPNGPSNHYPQDLVRGAPSLAFAGNPEPASTPLTHFVWRHTASTTARSRGWLNEATATLPPSESGVGLPALDTQLQAMAIAYATARTATAHMAAGTTLPPSRACH